MQSLQANEDGRFMCGDLSGYSVMTIRRTGGKLQKFDRALNWVPVL
jgi:hypothetical protein